MKPRFKVAFGGAISLALAVTVTVNGGSASAIDTGTSLRSYTPIGGELKPGDSSEIPDQAVTDEIESSRKCVTTPPTSQEHERGIEKVCTQTGKSIPGFLPPELKKQAIENRSKLASAAKARLAAVGHNPEAAGSGTDCSMTQQGTYTAKRMSLCMKGALITGVYYDTEGKVDGTAVFQVDSSYTLNDSSTTWSEQVTVSLLTATANDLTQLVQVAADCTSTCTMARSTAWPIAPLLTVGTSVTGELTFSDPVPSGKDDLTKLSYSMEAWVPGGAPISPATWSHQNVVRCDAMVANSSGCTHLEIRPIVEMTTADYGAAAATYLWGQMYLIDHWGAKGTGTPLTRAGDNLAEERRRITCKKPADPDHPTAAELADRNLFIKVAEVPTDSCDEFPFASTLESGKPGSFCAEVALIRQTNGSWVAFPTTAHGIPTYEEPCLRGHVPLDENTAVGQKVLSPFARQNRVVGGDKYYMKVTVSP